MRSDDNMLEFVAEYERKGLALEALEGMYNIKEK